MENRADLQETLALINRLKRVAVEVVDLYKDGYVDNKGNLIPPSPKEVGYLLSSLVQVAKLEREISEADKPLDSLTMVPWELELS